MEFSSFDTHCLEILEGSQNRFSRHCFRSAINHLKLAEPLIGVDNSMAAFRLYTAQEEAASGLIRILQELGYENARELNPKNHPHKNAFIPFFSIICQFIEDSFRQYDINTELSVQESEKGRLISLEVTMTSAMGPVVIRPNPPFNFSLVAEEKRFSYKQQIEKYVQAKREKDFPSLLQAETNKRNLVLYASPNGIPKIQELPPQFLPAYVSRVMAMLRAYLMISPYRERQPFIQDSLDAFISLVKSKNFEHLHESM